MSMTPLGTPLVAGTVSALPAPALTSAHRALMARIQDKCLDITQHHPDLVASCQYCGIGHDLTVRLLPRARLSKSQGGDGSFNATTHTTIYLPDARSRRPDGDALRELADTLNHLESVLPVPGGTA